MFKLTSVYFDFVLLAFGSCSCTADAATFGDGDSAMQALHVCTCDETGDCASSHVIGGELVKKMNE